MLDRIANLLFIAHITIHIPTSCSHEGITLAWVAAGIKVSTAFWTLTLITMVANSITNAARTRCLDLVLAKTSMSCNSQGRRQNNIWSSKSTRQLDNGRVDGARDNSTVSRMQARRTFLTRVTLCCTCMFVTDKFPLQDTIALPLGRHGTQT